MNAQPDGKGMLRASQRTSNLSEEQGTMDIATRINPRAASNILLFLIGGFFIILLVWAALTELDRTVRAQGRVVPGSQLQIVSNLEGGVVDRILVDVGDEVEAGAPLVRLDQTQSGSELGANQVQLDALTIKSLRLRAEVSGASPQFPTPSDASMAEQIAIERALHASRTADLQSLSRAARARVDQAQRAVAEAEAIVSARRAAYLAAQQEFNLIKPLVDRGIEPRFSLTQIENRMQIAHSEVQAANAAHSRAQASVAEAQASLAQTRQNWRARAADELAAAQAQRVSLRNSMPALANRVDRTVIRAPLAGRVNRVLTNTIGGTVRPGDPVVEIVPLDEELIVEAAVRPSDIAQVRIGQEAQVSISAYESVVYGSLDARVVTISPDTTVDERTGEPFYAVRIVTEGTLLGRDGNPVPIGPGMTADVSLLGEKQSILDYILTPITRLGRSALRE